MTALKWKNMGPQAKKQAGPSGRKGQPAVYIKRYAMGKRPKKVGRPAAKNAVGRPYDWYESYAYLAFASSFFSA